ncbi:MAG: endonuclease/exonuclease/phosphatase family protein [Chloroflexi bacterium]|jgi:endonuclease/exonuclease/phosphatase family metal-dependent hydrolase|uniref:Endonuclease/exonuclease/phosphatase n=1 Tax=Candidatus Thermofonsia Clade 3 bacterium TaxID=2364212 RepID=A0A2M8QGJ4_9CHLR|nr:endonuclease/exonuclease/phosphatase family protein [Candidatus Roseilinea sp. NK_OTU-006]PJF48945.1 MAG: endonuclease/exonuclease/phosphatase [Candidatus Thermofonsia Clade 3 bacterium]RMG65126.1 MAG: endonuclease/exonuclease/phosphatase family protein [Chloroflexota bacterium]
MFKLVTFNLLNKPSRWHDRRKLIVRELAELQPDVIALQEVSLPHNNAEWLADQLGGYTVHTSPKTGALAKREAVAMLSRLPVEGCHTLSLVAQSRVAQAVRLRVGDRPIVIVNGHFMFHVYDHIKRTRQVQRVLNWLRLAAASYPVVVCGDFNATPEMRTIRMMKESFSSAYEVAHGREPEYTCPTPLVYRFHAARKGLSLVGNLIAHRQPEPWRGTLDYIFVDDNFHVRSCEVVLNTPASSDPTLYPSDHVGLCVTLEVAALPVTR